MSERGIAGDQEPTYRSMDQGDELRHFLRCRSRMRHHVRAAMRRWQHMRRAAIALQVLATLRTKTERVRFAAGRGPPEITAAEPDDPVFDSRDDFVTATRR